MAVQVVTTRKDADFDAFASLVAACKLYPQAQAVYPESTRSDVAEFIALYKENLPAAAEVKSLSPVTLLIATAAGKKSEIELLAQWEGKLPEIHFYSNRKDEVPDLAPNKLVTAETGAVTTVMAERIMEEGSHISPFEAALFILGIYSATCCLTKKTTTKRDVAAVSRLWAYGADLQKVRPFLPVFWLEALSLPIEAVMSAPVKSIEEDTTVEKARELMMRLGYGGLPVTASGALTGMITRGEADRAYSHGFGQSAVKDFCSRNTIVIASRDTVGEALKLMAKNNTGRLLVKENGRLAGIVTRSDIIATLGSAGAKKETGKNSLPRDGDDLTPLLKERLSRRIQGRLFLVGQKADWENVRAHVAGGFVRDLLLGLPSSDLDIVVEPHALPFAEKLREYLGGRLVTYEDFGTATLFLSDGSRIDLVTARREFYPGPAALPEVETAGLKNDLFRRDFTINTMALCLNAPHFGRLVDFFGGSEDLERGIIRVLYNLSFVEDPLRVLRAVRFEQRFGFRMEQTTHALFKNAVKTRVLEKVSKERLADEFLQVFKEPKTAGLLIRYFETGIADVLFPGIRSSRELKKRLFMLQDALGDKKSAANEKILLPAVYLAALMLDLPFQEARHLCRRLRLPGDVRKRVLDVLSSLPGLRKELQNKNVLPSRLDALLGGQPEETLLLLQLTDNNGAVAGNVRRYREEIRNTKIMITGRNLVELGHSPGPSFGRVLAAVRAARLDGRITTREEELTLAEQLLQTGRKEGNASEKSD